MQLLNPVSSLKRLLLFVGVGCRRAFSLRSFDTVGWATAYRKVIWSVKKTLCWFVDCDDLTVDLHVIAPVVTTTSTTLSSNKIKNGGILIPANPGPPGKWPLKRKEGCRTRYAYLSLTRVWRSWSSEPPFRRHQSSHRAVGQTVYCRQPSFSGCRFLHLELAPWVHRQRIYSTVISTRLKTFLFRRSFPDILL